VRELDVPAPRGTTGQRATPAAATERVGVHGHVAVARAALPAAPSYPSLTSRTLVPASATNG